MKKKRFKATILADHKQNAVEVPFDPAQEWKLEPQPLWRGRRGYRVIAKINGDSFATVIVRRQKNFYLLIDGESARLSEGERVTVEAQAPIQISRN